MTGALRTAVVGSYPQPDWLVDRRLLTSLMAPRVRAGQIWRVAPEHLAEAQDDATRVAIRDQEIAGIDIVSDGEIRRESYSNRFANALDGISRDRVGEIVGRTGARVPVPLVTGPLKRTGPVEIRDTRFLRAHTDRLIKVGLPGPFTMSRQCVDEHYRDPEQLAFAFADAVNAEVHELFAAGADIVQLDEPWLEARHEEARAFGLAAVNRALAGAPGRTAVHLCFGYAALVTNKPAHGYAFLDALADCSADIVSIEAAQPDLDLSAVEPLAGKTVMLGALDLAEPRVEPVEVVAGRIRRALAVVPPERLIVAPDCGMKYLPRDVALGKLRALAGAARQVSAGLQESARH